MVQVSAVPAVFLIEVLAKKVSGWYELSMSASESKVSVAQSVTMNWSNRFNCRSISFCCKFCDKQFSNQIVWWINSGTPAESKDLLVYTRVRLIQIKFHHRSYLLLWSVYLLNTSSISRFVVWHEGLTDRWTDGLKYWRTDGWMNGQRRLRNRILLPSGLELWKLQACAASNNDNMTSVSSIVCIYIVFFSDDKIIIGTYFSLKDERMI